MTTDQQTCGLRVDKWCGMWLDNYMTNNACPACQTQAKRDAGLPCTAQELNTWSMWGCTCSAESAAAANEWMKKVTR